MLIRVDALPDFFAQAPKISDLVRTTVLAAGVLGESFRQFLLFLASELGQRAP